MSPLAYWRRTWSALGLQLPSQKRRTARIAARPATAKLRTEPGAVAPLPPADVKKRPPARPPALHQPCSGLVLSDPAAIDAALHRPRPPHVPLELWLQLLSEDT